MADDIYNWTQCNRLTINLEKTNFMIFKPSNFVIDIINRYNLKILINGYPLVNVKTTKYL